MPRLIGNELRRDPAIDKLLIGSIARGITVETGCWIAAHFAVDSGGDQCLVAHRPCHEGWCQPGSDHHLVCCHNAQLGILAAKFRQPGCRPIGSFDRAAGCNPPRQVGIVRQRCRNAHCTCQHRGQGSAHIKRQVTGKAAYRLLDLNIISAMRQHAEHICLFHLHLQGWHSLVGDRRLQRREMR